MSAKKKGPVFLTKEWVDENSHRIVMTIAGAALTYLITFSIKFLFETYLVVKSNPELVKQVQETKKNTDSILVRFKDIDNRFVLKTEMKNHVSCQNKTIDSVNRILTTCIRTSDYRTGPLTHTP